MKNNEGELNLEKFFSILKSYKWFILFLMLISTILMSMYLYFTPSVYRSNSIMEIQAKSKGNLPNDFLLNALSFGDGASKIEQEIEILHTYYINKEALKQINMQVNYYKVQGYKDVEIYKDIPITVKDVEVYNDDLIDKKFQIVPKKDGFTLNYLPSLKESIFQFTNKNPLNSNPDKIFSYDTKIKNRGFSFIIHKNFDFKKSLKISLNGNNHIVYDDIIQKKLHINQINSDAPLIEISYEDTIPKRANDYINTLMKSFINQSIHTKNEQTNKILTFVNERLNSIKNELETSEGKLENFKIKNKIVTPSSQASGYIDQLANLEIQLSENQLKEKLLENLIIFARHNQNLDSIAPSLVELKDNPTIQLISSLQTLQLQEGELSAEFTDQYPKLKNIRRQILNIRKKIILNIKNLKASVKQKNAFLLEKKRSFESQIQKLPVKEKKMLNIQRGYKVSSTLYDYLLKKKTESELLIVSTMSDYKVIDPAHTIINPIKPKRTLMMIIAPLFGLLIGTVLAIMLQGFNNKINSKEDLEELTDLPLLGVIPMLKKKEVKLEVYRDKRSPFTESYRSLRSYLPVEDDSGLAKIILLSSIIANEGKTTITANLAGITQMTGAKVIILNLDLRKPNLHHYFDLKNERGMSSYLSGKDTIQDIIFATRYTNLHVITSGEIPDNPSELILSSRLTELLDILKTRYDYIFIDSAPVGLVSDTIHLMKIADCNLIVFKEQHAEKSFVPVLEDIIKKNHLKNIGLILNQSNRKNSKTSYGYGYGYE